MDAKNCARYLDYQNEQDIILTLNKLLVFIFTNTYLLPLYIKGLAPMNYPSLTSLISPPLLTGNR